MTVDKIRRARGKALRSNTTGAEQKLWRLLRRGLPVDGSHWRRQVPIGPYVADFCCLGARLVVELDGSQHAEREGPERDRRRTAFLEAEGYRVVRFWNSDVTRNPDGVLEAIHATLQNQPPHPGPAGRPSPLRGG